MTQQFIYTIIYDEIPAIYEFDPDKDDNILRAMFYCNTFQEADEFAKRLNLDGYISTIYLDALHQVALKYSCAVFLGTIVNGFLEFQQALEIDEQLPGNS